MTELLDLVFRWIHLIAGIMWVGNSMLFNFLDRNLRRRPEADSFGDIWLIHSGGFYLVEKNTGQERPGTPHAAPWTQAVWFKWQAYTTWLTGAALLIVVYYVGGRALLVDPAVYEMPHATATIIAVSLLVGAWAAYEILWRSIGRSWPRIAGALSLIFLVDAVVLYAYWFSGRAAYLHVGALLATIMAGNVVFTIVPSQRELVAALGQGREPSQEIADRAKTRSIHNNYITFPVIALMLSAHFPSLYSNSGATGMLALIAAGAIVRHVLNVRFDNPRWQLQLGVALAASVVVLAVLMRAGPFARSPDASAQRAIVVPDVVTFADARRIIDRRCTACHSQTPSDVSLGATPSGITFDTPEQIQALAPRISERAILQRTMPPGNKTRMTELERAKLAKWLGSGAK